MMIEAMKKLENKELDYKQASSMAILGKTVIDAHHAELETVKTLKALQVGGIINDNIQYLEPSGKKVIPKIDKEEEDKWLKQDRL